MGLYTITCPICAKQHSWFSGNADQRCLDCKNPTARSSEENKMDYQQAHLDALNKVISTQNELINYLKTEIERLKASQLVLNPPTIPAYPQPPYVPQPGLGQPIPFIPGTPPQFPYSPFIVTSGDTKSDAIIATGDPLPLGSIQSGTQGINLTSITTSSEGMNLTNQLKRPEPLPVSSKGEVRTSTLF